jgi:hypothetical protein
MQQISNTPVVWPGEVTLAPNHRAPLLRLHQHEHKGVTKMTRVRTIAVFLVVIVAMVVGLSAAASRAADHLESPLVTTDGRLDINDVYVFQSPTNSDYTVLIMTVNPVAGILSPTTLRPAPGDRYIFHVDNDGDAVEDLDLIIRADPARKSGRQKADLYLSDVDSNTQQRISSGNNGTVSNVKGGGSFFHGVTDDPFFFDLQAFRDQVKGAGGGRTFCDATPTNFFLGLNVTSIAVEIPSSVLTNGDPNIAVWGETNGARVGTFDRMGRPAIATVLINDGNEDAFNMTAPADDLATWGDEVSANLQALGGYDEATADTIAAILLPDVLTFDTSSASGFLNGRRLEDDVIDAELAIVTNSALDSDCVDNDSNFSATFPYLAPPN